MKTEKIPGLPQVRAIWQPRVLYTSIKAQGKNGKLPNFNERLWIFSTDEIWQTEGT